MFSVGQTSGPDLQPLAVLRQDPDPVQHQLGHLPAHGVEAPREVGRGILLARHQLVRVEQAAVGTRADLVWSRVEQGGVGRLGG